VVQVIFEVTRRCPARCPFCTVPRADADMPLQAYARALQLFLSRFREVEVVLSGGEPTLSPLLEEYIWVARALGCPVTVVTNAANPEAALRALDAGADLLEVSLDYYSERQDAVRGVPGLFRNALRLIEAARGRVVIRATLLPDNLQDIERMAREHPGVPVFVMPVRGMNWRPPREWIERLERHKNVAVADSCPAGVGSFVVTVGDGGELEVLPCIFYRERLGVLREFTREELEAALALGRALPRFPCEKFLDPLA